MSRYTSSYSSFVERLGEVNLLRSTAADLEQQDPLKHRDQINALCRGTVVLLSSHLEAFIKELGEILLTRLTEAKVDRSLIDNRFFYHVSKDSLDRLRDTSDPQKIASAVFNFLKSDHQYWSKSGPIPRQIDVERFNKGFSNPAFKKIKRYFNRFGFSKYEPELARKLTHDFLSHANMVTHLVDTRNLIAHGDPRATKTPRELRDMTDMVKTFCRSTDDVFADWCKARFCVIR